MKHHQRTIIDIHECGCWSETVLTDGLVTYRRCYTESACLTRAGDHLRALLTEEGLQGSLPFSASGPQLDDFPQE